MFVREACIYMYAPVIYPRWLKTGITGNQSWLKTGITGNESCTTATNKCLWLSPYVIGLTQYVGISPFFNEKVTISLCVTECVCVAIHGCGIADPLAEPTIALLSHWLSQQWHCCLIGWGNNGISLDEPTMAFLYHVVIPRPHAGHLTSSLWCNATEYSCLSFSFFHCEMSWDEI